MSERLFKCLEKGRVSPYANFQWPYRKWVKAEGELVECENGIHLCREKDLIHWLNKQIWEAEARGERVDCVRKIIVREARLVKKLHTWNERTAKLFACDRAEHVLSFFEKQHPDDKRLRKVVEIARKYALGEASEKELEAARNIADAVSGVAARVVKGATTRVAAKAAESYVADTVVLAAAQGAARAVTYTAALAAQGPAERRWQTKKLMAYLYPHKSNEKKLDRG